MSPEYAPEIASYDVDPRLRDDLINVAVRKITILGKSYSVDFKGRDDGMVSLGTMDRSRQRIRVFDDMAYDQRCETLLHEVLHAIDEELKLGLSEVTICRLAVGLHSAGYIRDPESL